MSVATYTANVQGTQAQQQIVGTPSAIASPSVPAFQFTVLTNYMKLLTKTIYPDNRAEPCYARKFRFTYHQVETLEEFTWALEWMASEQHRCIIRGQLKPELNPNGWYRRLIHPSYDKYTNRVDPPTIDCPWKQWVPIDADGVRVPAGLGAPDKLAEAGYYVRDNMLPEMFHGIRCVVTATSKTGLVGEDTARLRLFFMLAEATDNDLLRVWLEKLNLEYPFIDPSVCDPEHIIYTARPKFIGRSDPVPVWGQVRLLDGYEDTIAPELPTVRVRKKHNGSWHPAPLTSLQIDWSNTSQEYLDLCEQCAGMGVHPIEPTSAKAWNAIRRMFDMLKDCPKAGRDREKGGSRHYTLTAVAWELAHLVAECEMTRRMAMRVYLKAAEGINHTANGTVYDSTAIHRRFYDAFNDLVGKRQ